MFKKHNADFTLNVVAVLEESWKINFGTKWTGVYSSG